MPKDRDKPLRGKTALITGAARRLGRVSALRLAEAGANVAITFLNSAGEAQRTAADLRSLGVRSVALQCDITDEQSVKSTIGAVVRQLGELDILVNNAANYETVEFEKITLKQWDGATARSSIWDR
jgi:3-oxoacyl-[acyl-carrier protein] reductase/pteridine reductase